MDSNVNPALETLALSDQPLDLEAIIAYAATTVAVPEPDPSSTEAHNSPPLNSKFLTDTDRDHEEENLMAAVDDVRILFTRRMVMPPLH